MTIRSNPWVNLVKEPPFVLQDDKLILDKYIHLLKGTAQLRFEAVPMPYIGNPLTAKVLLLALNPGFREDELSVMNSYPAGVEADIKNLTFANVPPFYFIDKKYNFTGGFRWWFKRLRLLIENCGVETVATSVACVQFFPYHSVEYGGFPELIPSQAFSFELVKNAIKEKKLIVFMRSKKIWFEHIPELINYPFLELKSPRSPFVTPANLSKEGFELIVDTIKNK
jgi:hypothetical protein